MQPEREFLPLVTAHEIRAAEQAHPGYPESMAELMERAGAAVARLVLERFPGSVAVVCGRGSNGGDGRIAARLLREAGREVTVIEQFGELGSPDVVVDALFGTGFRDAPREDAARMIQAINGCGASLVAVDVPSGVNGSTGEVPGEAVRATATVTMEAAKLGLVIAPGRFHAGVIHVAPIGLALSAHEHRLVPASVVDAVPRKDRETNKYRAGAVLVVGGSRGLTGAVALAAEAAFRADAGYVTVAVPASSLPVVEGRLLEAVKRGLPEDGEGRLMPRALPELLDLAARAGSVAIGPGLGRSDGTRELVRRLLEELDVAVVVDADGLWELEPFARAAPTVLTPHAGELGRLLGESSEWVDAHRLEAVRAGAERFGCVCLLKGSDTLVAAPGAGVSVSLFGEPALATAGTGDVLTGVVAAFLAKGMEPRLAAAAAAAVHGLAARLHNPSVGMVASDLLETIPHVLAGEASGTPAFR
jgi:ADP-dependent NAD(P)H-hydrate dehydratase / NAD(P)H-hydrate epimerase